MNIATLEIHNLKELLFLRKIVQDRMALLEADNDSIAYSREGTIEYLTLGQILVRLPEPRLLTPQVCTEADISLQEDVWTNKHWL